MKRLLLSILIVSSTCQLWAQVTTNGGSGLAANYATLAEAITALNGATISSPVIITVTVNETAPAGGYQITATGTSVNTITILGKSATITASASHTANNLNDAVFKVIGGDYITIRDFTILENSSNNTTDPGTNNMTEWGIAILPASVNNGAKNITISNNTIGMNKSYANSFGIYASTAHSAADPVTESDITSAEGANDNLKVTGNTITNVNIPIAAIGSPAFPGNGLNIGGMLEGNTLTNWGVTSMYTAYARIDNKINAQAAANFFGVVPGIIAVNQIAPNISYNTLTSDAAGNVDGVLVGIYAVANGTLVYPGTETTTKINNNQFSLSSAVNGAAAAVPLITGIRIQTGDAAGSLEINNSVFAAINHTTPNAVGADTLVYSFAPVKTLNMNGNNFTGLQFAHTGNLAFLTIHGKTFMPVDGVQNIKNNTISQVSRTSTAAVGLTTGILKPNIPSPVASDGSEAGSSFNAENNLFSNINTNGGGFNAFTNFDGKQGLPTLTKNVKNNTCQNIDTRFTTSTQTGGGAFTFLGITSRGAIHDMSDNLVDNIITSNAATAGNITGIMLASYNPGMTFTIKNNILRNLDGGQIMGTSFSGPGTIENNQFYNLTGRITIGQGIMGINMASVPTGAVVNIANNKFGNFTNLLNGTVNAIYVSSSAATTATINIYNNRIADLNAPISTNVNAINGIHIGSAALTVDIAHNTIWLNAASASATTFGSSCILFNSLNASLKMRNNILMNLSTPAQEGVNNGANGVSAVLRRNSGSLGLAPANYNAGSNNNLFYANASAGTANHLVYVEGGIIGTLTLTNSQNTLAQYKAFMATPDQASETENTNNVPFISTNPESMDFLKVDPRFIFNANNKGMVIAEINTDFEGEVRSNTTPDMGADEYLTNGDAWPLPVSLINLSGSRQNSDILLTWTTATEQHNKGFEVERSTNGSSFTTVGFVETKAANGNSNQMLTYQFTDNKASGNAVYYRLAQVDLDGRKRLSNVIYLNGQPGITATAFNNLYPNPAKNMLTLVVESKSAEKATVMITDLNGRVMHNQQVQLTTGTNTVNVNVNRLAIGFYLATVVQSESGQKETLKFMKQ